MNIAEEREELFQWKVLEQDERMVTTFSQKLSIPDTISRILYNRGITSVEEAETFIFGKLADLLPNPFLMKDMEKSAKRVAQAIKLKEKITIFGDYDVDGATSSALLFKFFKDLGLIADIYIPSRLNEGYGPNVNAIRKISNSGCTLVITVDCGTAAFEPLLEAFHLGLDVIVVDHHLASHELPKAYGIVNPNRLDDNFPYKEIAAVAVAFFLVVAIRKTLRDENWFERNNMREPNLSLLLDLVSLGTVCDVMPLKGINRIFVKYGLELIRKRRNLGISTLIDVANIKSELRSYHLGYIIGPRINAGGRVSESHLGSTLLISEDKNEAHSIAYRLEQLNEERKLLESQALFEAVNYLEMNIKHEQQIVVAVGHNWHIGVLGILASRLKDRYNKPSIVVSIIDGIGKGSARSIKGIDIGSIISNARAEGIILDGGGHAMAGGFSVLESKIVEFEDYILHAVKSNQNLDFHLKKAKEVSIDIVVSIRGLTKELMKNLEKLEPFGNANFSPRFLIKGVKILKVMRFGNGNLLISISDNIYEATTSKDILRCVFFRAMDKKIGQDLLESTGAVVDLIGTLSENMIDPRGIQFLIDDLRFNV